mmetsp:Transcript_13606/g.9792  ORF Transcript_13606/g.9792 Transcript_13606/m.9792 type:complete len:87 (+) Transcript_13606:588-848(+)
MLRKGRLALEKQIEVVRDNYWPSANHEWSHVHRVHKFNSDEGFIPEGSFFGLKELINATKIVCSLKAVSPCFLVAFSEESLQKFFS